MMENNKIILASMLHDIGKVFTNYLSDYVPEIIADAKRIASSHTHAVVGAIILKNAGFPPEVVAAVAHHHDKSTKMTPYVGSISKRLGDVDDEAKNVIIESDNFDASFRRTEVEVKGEPIEIAKKLGLSAFESLHGDETTKLIESGLTKLAHLCEQDINKAISFSNALLREISIHLRASQPDPIISLYAHSKIPAAITSSIVNFPKNDLRLISVKVGMSERAKHATANVAEYFAGLHLYSYFGLIGCVAKSLQKFDLNADVHIVAESSTHLLLILPENTVEELIEYFRLFANDILCPVKLEIFDLRPSNITLLKSIALQPELQITPLGAESCSICKKPSKEVVRFPKIDKDLVLCSYCSRIAFPYRIFASNRAYSIVEDEGLFVYPSLKLGVVEGVADKALIRRILNPSSSQSVLECGFPSVDLFISSFKKDLKIWAGISLHKLVQRYISENKLHAAVSLYQITPLFLGRMFRRADVNPIEITSSGAIFQCSSLNQASMVLKIVEPKDVTIGIVKSGAPGMTYQKLNIMLDRLIERNGVIAVYSVDNILTQDDLRKIKEIRLKIFDFSTFIKSLLKVRDIIEAYLYSEDEVERVYAKSELLRLLAHFKKKEIEEGLNDLIGFIRIFGGDKTAQKETQKEEISELLENREYVQTLLKLVDMGLEMEEFV